ncbi:putative bifunctional diguanylate cyclase/phosphodiesterase [Pseudoduganella aquatica]|uniref:EAL domain-containing protein n=1 Tax=Pseudoduganella aquatica TaxID=2660641 RepID=A0A7X4KLP5_9BURK|nr:GGDEF domain-containing phosphodiesterase [Pseudoduganella aquatica]MYN07273.1 EAL domain-containing protein [Pseudoduganella aquatica]
MGIYARLFVPIFLLVTIIISVRYTLLTESESAAARQRYEVEAQQLGQYLAAALRPLQREQNENAISALLAGAAAQNPDLALVRWEHAGGQARAASDPDLPGIAHPAWLGPAIAIEPLYLNLRVPLRSGSESTPGANAAPHAATGTLSLWFRPTQPLNRVWRALRQQAIISALNVVTIFVLLGLLVYLNRRMQLRLENATSRFQNGELGVRMPVAGSLEARAMATTFNSMASQVQALVHSLQDQKERIEVTLASIGDAVITTGLDGRIGSMNEAAQQLTGYSEEQACGKQLQAVFTLANNFGHQALKRTMHSICAGGAAVRAKNQTLRQPSGASFVIEYTVAPIRRNGHGEAGAVQGAVLVFRDVSEKKQLIQQMSWQSQHDLLTGLPNRSALAARFEHELELAREQAGGATLAVCMLDLDHFQQVNERGGHALGDEILKQAAGRLHSFAGPRHYAARLGGDEFVLLLPDQPGQGAVEHALAQLMALLARPYHCETQTLSVPASAGVALYTGGDISADSLLRQADQALYQAKLTGRNKVHYFDAHLDEEVRTHHNRRTEVRAALRAGELCLFYQPKLDMRAGRIIGMEALLRWRHPLRGIVGPMEFLPVVEHTDLIVEIGDMVLRHALRQLEIWRASHPGWVVSVNIAARHFQRTDFVPRLTAILAEFPTVPPRMLELEILESSALADIGHVRAIMLECQALGIRFALDDFGTGYSSMSYLKRLPAEVLKIDQSFVRNMLVDRDDLHLVSAVIGLARAFNRSVIAEGVETVEHGAQLMRLGCELAQGYGIARPMPADDVLDWTANFASTPAWQRAALLPIDGMNGAPSIPSTALPAVP